MIPVSEIEAYYIQRMLGKLEAEFDFDGCDTISKLNQLIGRLIETRNEAMQITEYFTDFNARKESEH